MGTREATVLRRGEPDRIVVQVPGLQDPSALKELLGKTAKLEFKLVDTTANAGRAQRKAARRSAARSCPILRADASAPAYIGMTQKGPVIAVKRQVMVSGDELIDAKQDFDPQDNSPVVDITFNGSGANKFARMTQKNVNKPFAMLLDGSVLSAPNINRAYPWRLGADQRQFHRR